MTVSSVVVSWTYTRNKEEDTAPSPSEPPEAYQLKAQNRKVTSQNEAAITFKGTMRYYKTEILSQVKRV